MATPKFSIFKAQNGTCPSFSSVLAPSAIKIFGAVKRSAPFPALDFFLAQKTEKGFSAVGQKGWICGRRTAGAALSDLIVEAEVQGGAVLAYQWALAPANATATGHNYSLADPAVAPLGSTGPSLRVTAGVIDSAQRGAGAGDGRAIHSCPREILHVLPLGVHWMRRWC